MKRSLPLAAALALLALAALVAGTTGTAGAASPIGVKAVCTAGPIRCMSVLRTDIPVVANAQAAHGGYGPVDLRAAYNIKQTAMQPNQTFWDHYYNHPGVAITASAGDYDYGTIRPAASPYVTAIGGTSLSPAKNARGWTETVWGSVGGGLPSDVQGTGSGCSLWEPKPAWQKDAGCTGRTVADVAAVADPGTGVAVYDSSIMTGGWGVYGGTSVSSPIIAGFYAPAGNAKRLTYGSYPYSHTSALYDVTEGTNFTPNQACGYLCTAGEGYDGPTGLGTPNGTGAF